MFAKNDGGAPSREGGGELSSAATEMKKKKKKKNRCAPSRWRRSKEKVRATTAHAQLKRRMDGWSVDGGGGR
jgi:hypothetical protein